MAVYVAEESEKNAYFCDFAAFNDGAAFRHDVPLQPSFQRIIIEDELTELMLT